MPVRAFAEAIEGDSAGHTWKGTRMQRSQGQPSEGLGRGITGFIGNSLDTVTLWATSDARFG